MGTHYPRRLSGDQLPSIDEGSMSYLGIYEIIQIPVAGAPMNCVS